MDRRHLLKNSLALGGLVGLGGCAATPPPAGRGQAGSPASSHVPIMDRPPPLAPIRAHTDRLFDIKVCIRPFRTKGPNLDVEQIGDAMVVHNYGHGGSGWSLSWGSANMAVQKAMSVSPKQIAVIGCGIIGLTSAITAQRAGAQVTIYTRELLPRTRSVRANGSWTPDSRICPGGGGAGEFRRRPGNRWRACPGRPCAPIWACPAIRWPLPTTIGFPTRPSARPAPRDPDIPPLPPPSWTGLPTQSSDFGRYDDRIADLTPQPQILTDDINPFPVKHVTPHHETVLQLHRIWPSADQRVLRRRRQDRDARFPCPVRAGASDGESGDQLPRLCGARLVEGQGHDAGAGPDRLADPAARSQLRP